MNLSFSTNKWTDFKISDFIEIAKDFEPITERELKETWGVQDALKAIKWYEKQLGVPFGEWGADECDAVRSVLEKQKNKQYTYYDITYKDESGTFYTHKINKTKVLIHEIQDKDKNQYPYGYITIQTKYGQMTFTKKTQYDIYLYEQDINNLLNDEAT